MRNLYFLKSKSEIDPYKNNVATVKHKCNCFSLNGRVWVSLGGTERKCKKDEHTIHRYQRKKGITGTWKHFQANKRMLKKEVTYLHF